MTTHIKYKDHLRALGVSKLKIEQKRIVTAVINRKDALCILPTGFGKSLCYVLPHLMLNRNVVIISPLVSLIHDQEQKYKKVCNTFVLHGSRVAFNGTDGVDVSQDIQSGKIKSLIFMTPEKLLYQRKWITSLDILTIAIDECHCITEWANFRQGYQELQNIVTWFIDRPSVLALTATATAKTVNTISTFFNLIDPLMIRVSATRDDLDLIVERKTKLASDLKYMAAKSIGKTIIYCKTRKDTEKVAERLPYRGRVAFYHAGMSHEERAIVQDEFTSGICKVIVATIAFGMGVDIPDIKTVIHYGLPKDIESYCQEIGRAARTIGMEGRCYLLWGKGDMFVNSLFIRDISDSHEKDYQQKKTYAINSYVNNVDKCRMSFMAQYFDPESSPLKCSRCDVCLRTN